MNVIQSVLSSLKAGNPQSIRNLTVYPLTGTLPATSASYVVLGEALSSGQVVISEISSSGSVPTIKLTNRGAKPVLILDGEELVGCKQNRIVNLTILAPAEKDLEIPVSCVEMGRWNSVSANFSASRQTLYAGLRAKKVASVSYSMFSSGRAEANQAEIWNDISEKFSRMGSSSASSAMSDLYESERSDIDDYLKSIHLSDDQVGAVFGIDGHCCGIEVFDSATTCANYLPKITAGYRSPKARDWDRGGEIMIRNDLQKALSETFDKLAYHTQERDTYCGWEQVLRGNPGATLDLDIEDWLFFFGSDTGRDNDSVASLFMGR